MYEVKFIIKRISNEEETHAIITARTENQELTRDTVFLQHLRDALTKWSRKTKEGKEALNEFGVTFNVGDLAGYDSSASLQPFLNRNGIYEISVEVICNDESSKAWTFDTTLIDTKLP
jgi:hypothetical protein